MTRYEITRRQTVVALESEHSKAGYHIDEHGRMQVAFMVTGDGNPCTVARCERRAGDGFVCAQCVEEWETCLGDIPALVEDLGIAEQKRVRFAPAGGSNSGAPDPANWTAGYYLQRLTNELVGQIKFICETGHIAIPALGADTVAMSRWLLRQSRRISYLPEGEGAGLVQDLTQMYIDCVSVIEAPSRRKYVRECKSCGLGVWARQDADKARCACGIEYDPEAEYEARMVIARDAWVTVDEAHKASGTKLDTIKKWIKRGRLDSMGADPQRVRYGDVLDRAAGAKEKIA